MKLNDHFDLSDEEFERAFKNCTLSPDLFTHEAHLRLAWIHLQKVGPEKAPTIVCDQITAFVEYLGAQDKYHQTVTVAAVMIVHHFMQHTDVDNFSDFILQFPQLKTNLKGLIAAHYSVDIFQLEEAKVHYVEPDVIPFDAIIF